LRRTASRLPSAAAAACLLAGCALVDTLEPRADTLNRTFTDYRDMSTLLNIVRASRNEPMNFVVMTGTTGHGTLTGNQGLPTFILGPGTAAAPVAARNFSFGGNSLTESASNDFNVSVLDDPSSYQALMTPLDIATIAFFLQEQHIPLSLILPLFVNRIRIIPDSGMTAYEFDPDERVPAFIYCVPKGKNEGLKCEVTKYYLGDDPVHTAEMIASATAACRSRAAYCLSPSTFVYGYLYLRGLVFQAPAGAAPSPAGQLPYRICYDPVEHPPYPPKNFTEFLQNQATFADGNGGEHSLKEMEFFEKFRDRQGPLTNKPVLSVANQKSICDDKLPWTQPTDLSKSAGSQPSGGNTGTPSSLCLNGACAASKTQKAGMGIKARNYPWAYEFYDPYDHAIIQITTRSARGMYQYLGRLVAQQEKGLPAMLFLSALSNDMDLFKVVINGGSIGCFTSVTYSSVNYCIPTDAYNSKYTLSLLHEIVNLETKPNSAQQPNSSTVRTTP
jgi:hypothetical protein